MRDDEIRIGISSCLLGEEVRFDGGHKRDPFITGTLSRFVRFVPVCPEMELGLGAPRESLRLTGSSHDPRLIGVRSETDRTGPMKRYARKRSRELESDDLSGYVFKKDSPSCGLFRVKVYGPQPVPRRTGRGLFATALTAAQPHLPVEEEGRLRDPRLRENFFERVFAYRRARRLFAGRWTVGDLVRFHTVEKLLLLAHHRPAYQDLGRLVATAKRRSRPSVAAAYQEIFMAALSRIATVPKHVNVLQHICGHFKKKLSSPDRTELADVIEDFRHGLVPLIVPVTLIRHHVRVHDVEYLAGQTYLEPHPKELMLRNHV
jgi:uncharacterized protein YbgA (DUF1722 family)/uncharacterized protein YbbK (DUF523 family)